MLSSFKFKGFFAALDQLDGKQCRYFDATRRRAAALPTQPQ